MSDFKVKISEVSAFSKAYAQVKWCREQFGGTGEPKYHMNTNIVNDLRWWCRQGHIYFREEKDYVWFQLRWA